MNRSLPHCRTFARLQAFLPRVVEGRVTVDATVLEPTASAGAARGLAGIVDDALGTFVRDGSSGCTGECRDRYCCVCESVIDTSR